MLLGVPRKKGGLNISRFQNCLHNIARTVIAGPQENLDQALSNGEGEAEENEGKRDPRERYAHILLCG